MDKEKIEINEKFNIKEEYSFRQAMKDRINKRYGLEIKLELRKESNDEIRR